jgi:hypothetical protein
MVRVALNATFLVSIKIGMNHALLIIVLIPLGIELLNLTNLRSKPMR